MLREGGRGVPGGDSLPQLLARERGVRNVGELPDLSEAQILAWARAHHESTGEWPHNQSGPIPGTLGENWRAVERALREGRRGMPGGDSVAKMMARCCGDRNKAGTPRLTIKQVLDWADAHRQRTGQWPRVLSGAVPEAAHETWQRIDTALREGLRGFRRGNSLAGVLAKYRGARNKAQAPPLSPEQILKWADHHFRQTGDWPRYLSGAVLGAPGETWAAINIALQAGLRSLPGGDSLPRLLRRERGVVRQGGRQGGGTGPRTA
jgi:hypothetical protein